MLGLDDLPAPLRRYLVAIAAGGPVAAVGAALGADRGLDGRTLPAVALLVLLAGLGDRFPLHLTHKTNVNVATAPLVALVLLLPPALPGLLALLAVGASQASRFPKRRDPIEALFNTGQAALYVTAGALVHAAARDAVGLGPAVGALGGIGAIALTAAALHAANTALVAGAAALHLGRSPLRVWAATFADDLPAHAVLSGLGVVAALLAADYPLALPILALPVILVRKALVDGVRLRTDTHAALAALVEVVELRDRYTAGHCHRVAETARALALGLGLTAEEADLIESAGRVHDVGKVAIDPAVLTKPARLTDVEYEEMKRHPTLGADVVRRFTTYRDGVPLVRHHHERWDGGGYPDGLAGRAIPLGARILAVADAFDALTSARPYRQAMSQGRALAILAAGAGSQWDPAVVAALFAHLGAVGAEDASRGVAVRSPAVA